jgi:hypothetical protein
MNIKKLEDDLIILLEEHGIRVTEGVKLQFNSPRLHLDQSIRSNYEVEIEIIGKSDGN